MNSSSPDVIIREGYLTAEKTIIKHMKQLFQFILFTFFTTASIACSAKLVQSTENPGQTTLPAITATDQGNDLGNCPGPRWGDDSVAAVTQYSLYREYFRQGNIKDAIGPWRKLLDMAPQSTLHLYVDGPEIIDYLIQNTSDETVKLAYVDTLMLLYDKRIECFGRRGFVLGQKAVDLLTYRPDQTEQGYEMLHESIQLQGNEMQSSSIYPYIVVSARMYERKAITLEQLLNNYEKAIDAADHNIRNNGRSAENYQAVKNATDDLMVRYLTCETIIPMYKARWNDQKNNIEQVKSMINTMDRANCINESFYLQASERLFELDPSADGAYALARAHHSRNAHNRAMEFYTKAIELEKDSERKAEMLMQQAQLQRDMRNLQAARSLAQRASQLKSNWGVPYLFIGDLYATSAQTCGNDDFEQRTVYWAAIDQYQRARSVDPATAEDANRRINTYTPHFPKMDDIFFREMEVGSSYTVGCWINENTTVRARP